MGPFFALFIAGVLYREYKKHKNSLILQLLTSMLNRSNSSNEEGISKATKSVSKAFLVKYKHDGNEFEIVVPIVRRKAMKWNKCIAIYPDGTAEDITEHAKYRAGPYKDFFGLHDKLKPNHIATNASEIHFIKGEKLVMRIGNHDEVILKSETSVFEETDVSQIDDDEAQKLLSEEF